MLELFANGGRKVDAAQKIRPHLTRDAARVQAWRWLRDATVRDALEALRAQLRERVPVEVEALAQRLHIQATGNITDVASWQGGTKPGLELKDSSELTPEAASIIEEVEITPGQWGTKKRVKLVNRTAAARLLLELRGELTKKVQVEGEIEHKHSMALPEKMPSREEWLAQYGPKTVAAKVESVEVNER